MHGRLFGYFELVHGDFVPRLLTAGGSSNVCRFRDSRAGATSDIFGQVAVPVSLVQSPVDSPDDEVALVVVSVDYHAVRLGVVRLLVANPMGIMISHQGVLVLQEIDCNKKYTPDFLR